jgi:peptidoglycan/LPS O-acetylase OafA/YrhL
VLSVHYSQAYPSVYVRTDTRADALLVGALLALALHFGWQPGRSFRRIAGWVGLAVLMAVVLLGQNAAVGKAHAGFVSPDRILYNGGFTIVALASAALILGALGGADLLNRGLSRRPVVATGRISYSLYLWHPIVFELVALAVAGSVARVALAWPAAFAVAAFSRRFVEEPFLDAGRSASRSQVPRRQAVVARPWMLALVATVVLVIAGADLAVIGQRNVTPPAAHAQPARTTQ